MAEELRLPVKTAIELQIPHDLLSREAMKRQLGSVAGMVYHVGSDPSPVRDGFGMVVASEAERLGFASWLQGDGPYTDMMVSPYYHPDLGLTLSPQGKIEFDESDGLSQAVVSPEGIDFHPEAAPGWYHLLSHAHELPPIRVLKTQMASPTCSSPILAESALPWGNAISSALVKGHLANARKAGKVVILSVDDPNPFSIETLRANFEVMFGDTFDANNQLVQEGEQVLRAIHCCGDWPVLAAMATGAVDVVHYDALQYGTAPIIGQPMILNDYLLRGGLIAWGGVPQNYQYLTKLADKLALARIEIRSPEDYERLAQMLGTKRKEAIDFVFGKYGEWLNGVSSETGIDKKTVASQVFISATCGYGSNASLSLRNFSYQLARDVADLAVTDIR